MSIMDEMIEKLISHYGGTKEEWLEVTKDNYSDCLICFDLLCTEIEQGRSYEIQANQVTH